MGQKARRAQGNRAFLRKPYDWRACSEPQGRSDVLKEAFSPAPPDADLDDIGTAPCRDRIALHPITEREVRQAIEESRSMKLQGQTASSTTSNSAHDKLPRTSHASSIKAFCWATTPHTSVSLSGSSYASRERMTILYPKHTHRLPC
jgi:hypothetical protein